MQDGIKWKQQWRLLLISPLEADYSCLWSECWIVIGKMMGGGQHGTLLLVAMGECPWWWLHFDSLGWSDTLVHIGSTPYLQNKCIQLNTSGIPKWLYVYCNDLTLRISSIMYIMAKKAVSLSKLCICTCITSNLKKKVQINKTANIVKKRKNTAQN